MNVDDALNALRKKPRPSPRPFFAARVVQRVRGREARRAPRLLVVYWVLFVCFTAALVLPTTFGIPLAIAGLAAAVFPEKIVAWLAPLLR
ncbi:MAG: hypothetical protein ACXW31_06245 [Thermoanaerobaculia bacterium]